MTRRLLGLAVAASLAASCDVSQPPINCPVQSLVWAASYQPKGPSECTPKGAETLGIQKFSTPEGTERLAITPKTLTDERYEADESNLAYSLGNLARAADAEGFCAATDLSIAHKEIPAGGGAPPLSASYRWSNVRILSTARAPGTQMVADVEVTEDGCTAQYEVWAMWPGVPCGTEDHRPDDTVCATEGTINPDFATVCDPIGLLCVPARRPPSLK